jgi:probable HAF family extracellular repeat protein
VIDLGTLGGNWSAASSVNSHGQIVGDATNTIPDAYGPDLGNLSCCGGFPGTQNRAVLWQGGVKHDLGTLPGGNDSLAMIVNESGQVAGASYTDATPNPTTGFPTEHPFLWQNGHVLDLRSLGGTVGYANDLNNRGEVIGTMNLQGDQTHHGFLWENGRLINLGTLGGANSEAFWMNDAGDVVGRADFSPTDPHHHAFLWKNGVMTDLGTLGGYPNSTAYGVNNRDQVIGDYGGDHGFLWENGSIYDLTSLLVPGSGIRVAAAAFINDRGEIYGTGALPNGDQHVILLVPR